MGLTAWFLVIWGPEKVLSGISAGALRAQFEAAPVGVKGGMELARVSHEDVLQAHKLCSLRGREGPEGARLRSLGCVFIKCPG